MTQKGSGAHVDIKGFAFDDLAFVIARLLPHLNCNSVWRILRAGG